jgi:hypothetical protein
LAAAAYRERWGGIEDLIGNRDQIKHTQKLWLAVRRCKEKDKIVSALGRIRPAKMRNEKCSLITTQ